MALVKKYKVSPVTKGWSSVNNKYYLETTSKVEANKRAVLLEKSGIEVSYTVDTYKNGVCIKNEHGYYKNGKVEVYSTINYEQPKKVKKIKEAEVTEESMRMFFSDADVEKWKQANKNKL